MILAPSQLVTPQGIVRDHWVRVDGERIAEVGSGPVDSAERVDGYLVPGFVDTHSHGGGGADFAEAEPERVATALAAHRAHGTTTMLASLVSAPVDRLAAQLSALAPMVADGTLAGVHLEGPFISHERRGAHDPAALRDPDAGAVAELLDAGGDALRMITVAPERAGAVDAIKAAVAAGVTVAIGHTDATEAQVRAGVDAGATVGTHLFNGMRPLHHREPGPIGALLDDPRVTVELICDLVHLAPTAVHLAATHAGPARTVLVTDAMSATGLGDGTYDLGGLRVTVRDGTPRLDGGADGDGSDGGGALAASTLTMDRAFANYVRCGMSLPDAVAATAARPAELHGLADVGAIRAGCRADLVLLDGDLAVTRVMHRGAWV